MKYWSKKIGCALCLLAVSCLMCFSACAQNMIRLPEALTVIGEQAFDGARDADTVIIPHGAKSIEKQAFAGSGLKYVYLPSSLDQIAADAFSGCNIATAYCIKDSYAHTYCIRENIPAIALSKAFGDAVASGIAQEELVLSLDEPVDGKTLGTMMENALVWMGKPDDDAYLRTFMNNYAQTAQIQRYQFADLLYGVSRDVINGYDFRVAGSAIRYEVGGAYKSCYLWDCDDYEQIQIITQYNTDPCNYAICSFDRKTGDKLLPIYEDFTFRPTAYVTMGSAAESLLHFARSFEADPIYVPVTDARASVCSIDPALYTGYTTLPAASNQNLPDWRGFNISYNSIPDPWALSANPDDTFIEANLDYIKEIGANFVHVYLSWNHLQGPDLTCDSRVNLERLKYLDDLISWCMERDIHIQLVFTDVPNLDGYNISMDEWFNASNMVFTHENVRDDVTAFWRMLARRYADIPNNYLSFNLQNECDPSDDEAYAWGLGDAVHAIWDESPGRVVVADVHTPNSAVRGETMAQLGCALSYHYYNLWDISIVRPEVEEANPGFYESISGTLINASLFGPTYWDTRLPDTAKGALKFSGAVGGVQLSITIEEIFWFDTIMRISADGRTLYEGMEPHTYHEEIDYIEVDKTVTVTIPADAQQFEISCPEGSGMTMSALSLTFPNGTKTELFPLFDGWSGTPLAQVTVDNNGNCSSTLPLEYLDQNGLTLAEFIEIGKKYNVDVMVGEIGIFESSPIAAGISQKATEGILGAEIDTFERLGLAWCGEYIGRYSLVTPAPYLAGIEYRDLEDSPYFANKSMEAFFKVKMAD